MLISFAKIYFPLNTALLDFGSPSLTLVVFMFINTVIFLSLI